MNRIKKFDDAINSHLEEPKNLIDNQSDNLISPGEELRDIAKRKNEKEYNNHSFALHFRSFSFKSTSFMATADLSQ